MLQSQSQSRGAVTMAVRFHDARLRLVTISGILQLVWKQLDTYRLVMQRKKTLTPAHYRQITNALRARSFREAQDRGLTTIPLSMGYDR